MLATLYCVIKSAYLNVHIESYWEDESHEFPTSLCLKNRQPMTCPLKYNSESSYNWSTAMVAICKVGKVINPVFALFSTFLKALKVHTLLFDIDRHLRRQTRIGNMYTCVCMHIGNAILQQKVIPVTMNVINMTYEKEHSLQYLL